MCFFHFVKSKERNTKDSWECVNKNENVYRIRNSLGKQFNHISRVDSLLQLQQKEMNVNIWQAREDICTGVYQSHWNCTSVQENYWSPTNRYCISNAHKTRVCKEVYDAEIKQIYTYILPAFHIDRKYALLGKNFVLLLFCVFHFRKLSESRNIKLKWYCQVNPSFQTRNNFLW